MVFEELDSSLVDVGYDKGSYYVSGGEKFWADIMYNGTYIIDVQSIVIPTGTSLSQNDIKALLVFQHLLKHRDWYS